MNSNFALKQRRLLSLMAILVVFLAGVACNAVQAKKPDPALVKAVEAGDVDHAKKLLEKGGDPNMKDKSGRPLITLVVEAPIASRMSGMPRHGPEHTIIKHWNHAAMVKLLVKYGAKVNVKDKNGWTPLLQAEYADEEDLVTFLKNAGARE